MPFDNNVYIKRNGVDLALLAVTVDDFCVACTTHIIYRKVLPDLRLKYRAKDLSIVKRLL